MFLFELVPTVSAFEAAKFLQTEVSCAVCCLVNSVPVCSAAPVLNPATADIHQDNYKNKDKDNDNEKDISDISMTISKWDSNCAVWSVLSSNDKCKDKDSDHDKENRMKMTHYKVTKSIFDWDSTFSVWSILSQCAVKDPPSSLQQHLVEWGRTRRKKWNQSSNIFCEICDIAHCIVCDRACSTD